MKYKDLRDFIAQLEQRGELVRVSAEVDPVLEITEIADRTLRAGGPALLFENVKGHNMPVLANLFGTPQRVALGMGQEDVGALREVGKLLAFLKEPEPPKGLKDAISKLPIPKLMRYQIAPGTAQVKDVEFVRPAHGLVAMHGAEIINIEALGLKSHNTTLGHRFLSNGTLTIKHADEYAKTLETSGKVIASYNNRLEKIRESLLKASNGHSVLMPESLLEEVCSLVEWPVVYTCEFEKEFLEVPQECLILTMQTNQKYFAMTDKNGKLVNQFLIVSNIETSTPEAIISGNERVVRPRLADAKFFYEQDRKKTLFERTTLLSKVVYHNKLGTQLERTERVAKIAEAIGNELKKHQASIDVSLAIRAAQLAKADLLTDMVGEFPELQGIMGRYYANHDGEQGAEANEQLNRRVVHGFHFG